MTRNLAGTQPADTLIVGAGLAGLVIAYRLKQCGLIVDVVEARDRPGGRIHSIANALGTGLTAELGGEAFDSDHAACLSLARELDLPLVDLWQQVPDSGDDLFWFQQRRLCPQTLQAEFTDLLHTHQEDWQAVQQFCQSGQVTRQVQALDALAIPDYLAQCGASATLQQALTTAYTIKYGMDAAAQSSLNLLSYFASPTDCAALFGHSDERYYIQGGNGQLTRALYDQVSDRVQLATQLDALTAQRDGLYQVTLRQGATVRDRRYRCVILTAPFSVLRRLDLRAELPEPQRRAIAELGYSTPTKLITAYGQKVWRQQGLNGLAYTDLPIQHCWEASDSLRSANTALLVAYPGGQGGKAIAAQSPEQIAIALNRDLSRLFPPIAVHRLTPQLLRSEWLTDPWSAGAYSCYQVGQWTAFYGWEGRRVDRLWFAGEHCSRRYQGYMEGACETAERVVAELLRDRALTDAAQRQRSRLQQIQQHRAHPSPTNPPIQSPA